MMYGSSLYHDQFNCVQYGLYLTLSTLKRFERISDGLDFIPVLSYDQSVPAWSRSLYFVEDYPPSTTCARVIEHAMTCVCNNISLPCESLEGRGVPDEFESVKCLSNFWMLDALKLMLDAAIDINSAFRRLLVYKPCSINVLRYERQCLEYLRRLLFPGMPKKVQPKQRHLPQREILGDFIDISLNLTRFMEALEFDSYDEPFAYRYHPQRRLICPDELKSFMDLLLTGLLEQVKENYTHPFYPFLGVVDKELGQAQRRFRKSVGKPYCTLVSGYLLKLAAKSYRRNALNEMRLFSLGQFVERQQDELSEWCDIMKKLIRSETNELIDFCGLIRTLVEN